MSELVSRHWFRSIAIAAFMVGLVTVGTRTTAVTACTNTISSLPATLNQAGAVYCLNNNITSGSGNITITASGVTLDGQNHSITASSSIYVTSGTKNNLVIRNLQLLNGNMMFGDAQHDVTCVGNTCTPNYWNSDMLIENNTFRESGYDYSPYLQLSVMRRLTFRNNTVESLSGTGNILQLHFTFDSTFENNTLKQTVASMSYPGETFGLTVRDSSSRNTFRNNIIVTNGQSTIIEGAGYGKNIVVDGVTFGCPSQNVFESNVLVSLPNSIGQARSGVYFRYCAGGGDQVKNNIFYSVQNPALFLADGSGDATGFYDHNSFVTTGPQAIPIDKVQAYKFTNNIIYGTMSYNGAGQVVSGTGYNLYSPPNATLQGLETNAIGASPQFVGPLPTWSGLANADDIVAIANTVTAAVHLQASSPAKNTASDGTNRGAVQDASSCTESWSCGAWSSCSNGTQTRTCSDANACGTTVNRPPLSQSCSCTESWTCGAWTSCTNGSQTRTCSDTNACGTTVNRPVLSQSCSCTENWSCGTWSQCAGGTQSRTCTDSNTCGTTASRPPLNQSCSSADTTPPSVVTDLHSS